MCEANALPLTSQQTIRTICLTYIRPKMEYSSHLWAGASKCALDFVDRLQSRVLKLIGDDRVVSSITSLGHRRNVSCIVLFYKYYFGKCSSGLSELIPPPQVFGRNTRLSGRSHALHCSDHVPPHYTLWGKFILYPYSPIVERLTQKYLS